MRNIIAYLVVFGFFLSTPTFAQTSLFGGGKTEQAAVGGAATPNVMAPAEFINAVNTATQDTQRQVMEQLKQDVARRAPNVPSQQGDINVPPPADNAQAGGDQQGGGSATQVQLPGGSSSPSIANEIPSPPTPAQAPTPVTAPQGESAPIYNGYQPQQPASTSEHGNQGNWQIKY